MRVRKNRTAAPGRLFAVSSTVVCLLAFGAGPARASQEAQGIKVNEPRPLAAALLILEARLKAPITYEDPPYQFPGDLTTLSFGPVIPKAGAIDFTYSDKLEPREIIRALLDAHAKAGHPGVFELKEAGGFYHVVPLRHRNQAGELVARGSILETPVNVSAQNVTGRDILELICKELSEKLNAKVVAGMYHPRWFSSTHESFTAAGRPAHACLSELIKKTGQNLSWQLFYDPKLKWYVLNFHPVGYTGQGRQ